MRRYRHEEKIVQQVPAWWIWASGIYFGLSILWTTALSIGAWMMYRKIMPLVTEARLQVRRVSEQARTVASKASRTADLVHTQAQHLLGNADSAGSRLTGQARTVGAALSGLLVAVRVINFVRKLI